MTFEVGDFVRHVVSREFRGWVIGYPGPHRLEILPTGKYRGPRDNSYAVENTIQATPTDEEWATYVSWRLLNGADR